MGFSYDDIHFGNMKLYARLTSWQVCGVLRNSTAAILGKYGVADFGADFDSREIAVSCGIPPQKNFAALAAALDSIAQWLDPGNGLKQLMFDDVPDRYFMARLNAKVDCSRLVRAAGSFDLTFFCPDPFVYAVDDGDFTITAAGMSTVKREKGNIESNRLPH